MEQTNSLTMNLLQTIAGQAGTLPAPAPKEDGDALSDFQKMLDDKAKEQDPLLEEPAKTPVKAEPPAKKVPEKPVQQQEDPIETSKKAQIVVVGQLNPETLPVPVVVENPATGQEMTIIQYTDALEPQVWGRESAPEELQIPVHTGEAPVMQVLDPSDPEADAILEATAPDADNSPAALLEKLVDEQVGKVNEDVAATQIKPVEAEGRQEEDPLMELLDADPGPQRIFQDVKAVPVKVGEAELPQQPDEPDVVSQLDAPVAMAIQQGDSTVTVKLNPENLGEVTVQVSMKENGAIAVALTTRNDGARAILERHSTNLQEMLSARVHADVEVDVQRSQENQQSQQQQQNYDGHNGHAQQEQRERRRRQEPASSQDFMQQLRLGLIPTDGEL